MAQMDSFQGYWPRRAAGALTRFFADRRGNVAMIFGIAALPLMIAMGVAIDYGNTSRVDQKLAGIADAVALAAANVSNDPDAREELANKFLAANSGLDLGSGVNLTDIQIVFDDENERVSVTLVANIDTTLMGLAGINHTNATGHSVAGYEVSGSHPVSLGLVLDVSGSMAWNNKIGTLRTAATGLLDQLHTNDPDDVYVRTGLTTYNTDVVSTVRMDWGVDHTRSVVQTLIASGGTASTRAVNVTGGWLRGNSESAHHNQQEVHGDEEIEPLRFLIFMTDGDNNQSRDDRRTKRKCDQIKADGIEIFSVAFEAPIRGRELLEYCSTDEDHYFDARNSQDFLDAFEAIGLRIQTSMLRLVE